MPVWHNNHLHFLVNKTVWNSALQSSWRFVHYICVTSDSFLQEVLTLSSVSLIAFCAKNKHKRQTSCLPQAQPVSASSDKRIYSGLSCRYQYLSSKTRSIASCSGLKNSRVDKCGPCWIPGLSTQVGWPLNSISLWKACFRVFRVCCHLRQIKFIWSDSIVRLLCHYLSDY